MFDQILKMATSQLSEKLREDGNIPDQEMDVEQVATVSGESILGTVSDELSSGNLGAIQEMLSGSNTTASNPLVATISSSLVSALVSRAGLSASLAQTVSSVAVPFVMNMFNKNVSNAQESGMDIGGLLTGVLGQAGGGGALGGILGSVLGGGNSNNPSGQDLLGSVLGQIMK